ncbi:MAG: hypothetical protein GXO93_02785 [FCB group bacterium]|nr:hypothetical protein [FCB group bacterium]
MIKQIIKLDNYNGFGLIELTVMIIIIGLMTSLAMQSMQTIVNNAKMTKTKKEMDLLAQAIVGNPNIMTNGIRSDFGYVGDIGAFPTNLGNLVSNTGGYSTWHGPYLSLPYTEDTAGYKTDEWGKPYNFSGGLTISSIGSGTTIIKKIPGSTSDYLFNTVNGIIKDVNDSLPNAIYADSVDIIMTVPNGTGGTLDKLTHPDSTGSFSFSNIPVGIHSLKIIYVPAVDTLVRYVTVLPNNKKSYLYKFASSYF